MGRVQVPGSLSGRVYNITIAGDSPTDSEIARASAIINEREQAFAADYEKRYGLALSPDDGTALGRGLDIGKTSAYEALGTAARDTGEAWDLDWLQNLGTGMEEAANVEQLREAAQYPAMTRWEDVQDDWWKLPTFLGEVAGQSIPEMGATLGATAAGTLVGGPVGGFAAGTAMATPFFYGRNIQRQEEQIAEGALAEKNRLNAFLSAGGSAVLNTIGDRLLLTGKALGLSIPRSSNLFVRSVQFAGAGAATELPTEITQQVLERAQAGLPLDNDEAIQEYIEVGIAAGLLGGAVGGASGPFRSPTAQQDDTRDDTEGTPPPGEEVGVSPAAAPSLSDVEPMLSGVDQALDAQVAAEEAAVGDYAKTSALLDALKVSPTAAMRMRLARLSAAPDSPDTIEELQKYIAIHEGNAKLMEMFPDTPQRIKEYIATVTAPKEEALDAQAESAVSRQKRPEAGDAGAGAQAPAGAGADVQGAAGGVGGSGDGRGATSDTPGADALNVGAVGTSGSAATENTTPTKAESGAIKAGDAELTPEQKAEIDARIEKSELKKRGPERAQKYPLSNTIGGLKRGSRLAKEIADALGVTPGGLPSSMYAKSGSGIAEVDEVIPEQLGEWRYAINIDETGNAFDRTDFINALIEEANGNPRRVGRQAELDAARREKEETARATELGQEGVAAPMPEQADYYVPPREEDISTDKERYDDLVAAVNRELRNTSRTLTQEEYAAVTDRLLNEGGSVTEAINAVPRAETPAEGGAIPFEGETGAPEMNKDEFDAWLDSQIAAALDTKVDSAPKRRRTANKKPGAKVSKRFSTAGEVEASVSDAVQDAKRRWDNELAVAWEDKLAKLTARAREEVRAFVAEPGDINDPTTAGDRKAVFDIVSVKRVSPADKKLPGMENAQDAKNYFDKFPTVAEGLLLLARDLGSDPKVTKLIDNKRKAQETGALPDWGEASSFLDANVGPKVAEKAVDWVQKNLSPAANEYLQVEVARMKRLERAARRRITKYAPTEESRARAEDNARTIVDEAVRAGKQVQGIEATQAINAAAAGIANAEAVAEAWAVDKTRVSMPELPKAVTATREELAAVKRPSIPRKKGETGADYAIRVMRPDFTPKQIKALSAEERLAILADAKASRDFLGGALYSKVQAVRQKYQMHQPLDQIATTALRNGQLESALRYVADRIQDPQLAALVLTIAENIRGTQVAVVNAAHPDLLVEEADVLRNSYGVYYPKHDTIVMNEDIGLTTSALIHEALHAVTLAELRKPGSQLRADLQKVLDSVVDEISIYMPGEITVEEFVSEVRTNPDMRARLAQLDAGGRELPSQAGSKSVLEWIKTLLSKFVKALNRTTRTPSALQTADFLIDMAITPERNNAPDILYSSVGAGNSAIAANIRGLARSAAKSSQNSRTKIADDVSRWIDGADNPAAKISLGLFTTQAIGDLAAHYGVPDPYGMLKRVQAMNAEYDRAIERVNYMRESYAKLPKDVRRTLDALMPASSIESVDLTRPQTDYDKWWLAFETVDANGNITGRRNLSFTSPLARDQMVARLNTNPPATRTEARATQDVDPVQQRAAAELYREYAPLSPAGKDMYRAMRDFYKQEYDALWETLSGNIDTALAADKGLATQLKKSAYLTVFGKGDITPYFPLVREGDFWLEFAAFNPITRTTEPVKTTFSSPRERDRFIAGLANVPGVATNPATGAPQVTTYTAQNIAGGASSQSEGKSTVIAEALNLLTKYQAKHQNTPQAISPQAMSEISQALVEAAPEGALAKQFHRRKNVAGYRESADLALEQRGYRLASAATRFKFGRIIREQQSALREHAATAARGPDGNKTVLVINELIAEGDNALKPQNSLAERAARLANKVTYAYTLLGSASSATVNFSGMANVVFPQLGGKYGYGVATTAITRAARDFVGSGYHRTGDLPVAIGGQTTETLRSMPSIDNNYIMDNKGNYRVNTAINNTPKTLARATQLLPLMQALGDRGMSHKSIFYDSAGLEEMGRARSLVERGMAFFGIPFHMVERMNRQVTAIAVYDLELARMDQKPTPAEALMSPAEKQAKAAQEAVYQAQYLNGSASMNTAPRLTQRGLGRVAFMYKNYGITIATVLAKTALQLAKNMYGGDKALRSQAMAQLTGHIGVTFLMAGAAGLPLFGVYAAVANAFRDDDELTAEEATRLWMGELAYKGVINHVTGLEVADRVGLSGLLYRSNRYNTDPTAEETLVQMVLGAPWATFSRIRRGGQDLASGEWQRGFESLLPKFVSDPLQAYRFYTEGGIRTRQGNFMYEDPTAMELFGKALGFNMAEYVRLQSRATEMSRVGTEVSQKRTRLLKAYFVASRTGDRAGMQQALQKIAEFNRTTGRRYPSAAITPQTIDQSFERRAGSVEDMINGVSVNPQVRPVLVQQYNAMVDGITRY